MYKQAILGSLLIGASGLLITGGTACSYAFCSYGSVPFNKQTAIATDSVIEIYSMTPFPDDLPAIAGAFVFETSAGDPVDFVVDYEPGSDMIALVPVDDLLPDTSYTVKGPITSQVEQSHSVWRSWESAVDIQFTTRSAPTLLSATLVDAALYLVFSEPVSDDVADYLQVSLDIDGDAQLDEDIVVEIIGPYDDPELDTVLIAHIDNLPSSGDGTYSIHAQDPYSGDAEFHTYSLLESALSPLRAAAYCN